MRARPGLHLAVVSVVSAVLLMLTAVPGAAQSTGTATQEAQEAEEGPGAQVGHGPQADYDWTLRGLDGRTFQLDRYRGKPLVLNMWATWCAPCVAELASLERLAESLAGEGVEFLIVSPEPVARVRAFMRRHGYELSAAVEDQRMPASYGLRALPTTYVLDGKGRIVLAHRGATDWDRDAVRDLLLRLVR